VRRLCQPLRTGSSRRCSGLDRDWYVSALPNQGHAGEDGGPQIDGCESECEHCAAVGTGGDLHLVLEEGMLLIGADVKADVIGPKTFIERYAYLISVHQLVQPFRVQDQTVLWPGRTTLIVAMTSLLIGRRMLAALLEMRT
jgi:hypothetical protein